MIKFYQPSGRAPLAGHVVAYSIAILLTFIASLLYNFIMVIIPFVYLNAFISGGFGIVLGYIVKSASKIGKQRTYEERMALCITICVLAIFFDWVAYINYLQQGFNHLFDVESMSYLLFDPFEVARIIGYVNEHGTWQIFGVTFKGGILSIIWLLEVLLIIGLPIWLCKTHLLGPYSNLIDKWYRKYTLNNFFESISTINEFEKEFAEVGVEAILKLKYGLATRYAEISIFYLADEITQFISISNIYVGTRGDTSRSETILFHLIEIDNKSAELLMKKYGIKKHFFLNY